MTWVVTMPALGGGPDTESGPNTSSDSVGLPRRAQCGTSKDIVMGQGGGREGFLGEVAFILTRVSGPL